jgi:hypothetical protein
MAMAERGGHGGDGDHAVRGGAAPIEQIGSVAFAGAFEAVEREYLARQFSICRFEMLARSKLDARVALISWAPALPPGGGASPLYAAPKRATYVLDGNALAAEANAPNRGQPTATGALTRVDSTAELHRRFAGAFPDARVSVSWWDRVRQAFRGALPGIIAAVVALWLAIAIWIFRSQ